MYPRNISYWAFLPGVVALGVLFFTLNYFPDRSVLEGICGGVVSALWFLGEWAYSRDQRRSRNKGNNFGLV